MTDTTAVISPEEQLAVSVSEGTVVLSSTNLSAPATVNSIDDIGDVDVVTEGKVNGSVLVFKTITNKWTSTTQLDAQNMEGGFF